MTAIGEEADVHLSALNGRDRPFLRRSSSSLAAFFTPIGIYLKRHLESISTAKTESHRKSKEHQAPYYQNRSAGLGANRWVMLPIRSYTPLTSILFTPF